MFKTVIAVLASVGSLVAQETEPPAKVERNVVYGMYSGLALLMDVYRPPEPNGHGVVLIWGSGWHGSNALNANQLKDRGPFPPLTEAGYTVFVVNHRMAPRFRYPAAVEDVQRAVRFIRHHAEDYGIHPDRIGGLGVSSGGHLVGLLGTLDGQGDPEDRDPVNRESARLQAIVSFAGGYDLTLGSSMRSPFTSSFIGLLPPIGQMDMSFDPQAEEAPTYLEASPVTHVSPDDAPFLLIHGDADRMVPDEQSAAMDEALDGAGVETRYVSVPNGNHFVVLMLLQAGSVPTAEGRLDMADVIDWFDTHLRNP